MPVIGEREVARQQGHSQYVTGRPCKYGHTGPRYTQNGMCCQCGKQLAAAWRLANPELYKSSAKQSALKHAERRKAYQRANSHKHKLAKWKRLGYPEPIRPCPERCEICDQRPEGNRGLHLDHCHDTGRFRGWLCFGCNTALGRLGDSPELLSKALAYLRNGSH